MNVKTGNVSAVPKPSMPDRGVGSGSPRPQRLSATASLILDITRFLAAVVVAMGHFTLPMFSTGLRSMMSAAAGAVGVFFVLSGFIIRYVTLSRESSLAAYLADRASRLYSVVLPALGFTVIADLIARAWGASVPFAGIGDYLLRFFATATFSSETWFQELSPAWNGPFWSLSFEAFYYVLYGLGFYLKGWKRIGWLVAFTLLAGPSILLLAPVWFLGSYLLDRYQELRQSRRRSRITVTGIAVCAAIAAAILKSIPHTERAAITVRVFNFNQQFVAWRLWKVTTWYYETGIVSACVLLAALLLFDRVSLSSNSRGVRAMRYIADGTFPLYLFHVPMMYLIRSVVPYDQSSRWQLATIFSAVIVVCVLLGGACNKLKDVLRGFFLKEAKVERRVELPVASG